jgi:hypothetical protein
MITSFATGMVALSCLGCAPPSDAPPALDLSAGPVAPARAFEPSPNASLYPQGDERLTRAPLQVGDAFNATRLSEPSSAARFERMTLSTPLPLRTEPGESWGGEVSFGAAAERTGLGFDVEVAPRAQIQEDRAGNNVARTGGEVRFGPNLLDRDQRGTDAKAPSWYFFVGEDNEALVWNFADKSAVRGAALRDQVTVGDLHAGVAWTTGQGSQMSLGLVEREMSYSDAAGNSASRTDQFAAFSYTLKR